MSYPSLRAYVLDDVDALAAVAAEHVVQCARVAVAARGRFLVALSGGSTPQALYRLLAGSAYDTVLPWSATVLLWGDERCVPPDDPESNYGMVVKSGLLERRCVSVERMRGELGADEGALEYERRLWALAEGGPGTESPVPPIQRAPADAHNMPVVSDAFRPPVIDLVLLGVGDDGHTASLLPGAPTLDETQRLVAPTDAYGGVRRITVTMPVLASARRLLFLVTGAGKAAAVAEMLGDPASRLPAAIVLRAARRAAVLLDEAAAAGASRARVLAREEEAPKHGDALGGAEVAPDTGVV